MGKGRILLIRKPKRPEKTVEGEGKRNGWMKQNGFFTGVETFF